MGKVEDRSTDMEGVSVNPYDYLIKSFFAGPSGSGKTQGMTTMPGRKLFVDVDNRAETLAGMKDISVVRCTEADSRAPKAWQDLTSLQKDIVSDIRKEVFPYDSIIYDGVTMMGRISMNWALMLDPKRGLGGAPAQQHYLPQMDALSKFMLNSLTIPRHIGYTGHMELHEDAEAGRMKFYPKITGKLRTELANWFNETYYCSRAKGKDGETVYSWTTSGNGREEFFKSSMNTLGKFWNDPIVINFDAEKVGFQDLLNRRFGDAWTREIETKNSAGVVGGTGEGSAKS